VPYIDVNGTNLHYIDEGPRDAPAIVFSHSMFFDVKMFEAQAARFRGSFRIVRYDHRGQGASAKAPRERLDMDTLTADAADLIEALELAPCTFVGNSMGGFVALRLAARRHDLIRSIVALGTSADVEIHSAEMDRLNAIIAKDGLSPVLNDVLSFMLGETTRTDPSRAAILASARETLLSRPHECSHAVWNISHRKSILDELTAIKCPVLLVAGTEDNTYPPDRLEQIKNHIPHAKLEYMARTGHVHALENPAEVCHLLEGHLTELDLTV
jgi:3-oxoadipate enol-lactonase